MLQAGVSRVRVPMKSLDFFNLPNSSSRTVALMSTQHLTEMSTRNLLTGGGEGVKSGRRVGLTTVPPSVSRLSKKCGSLDLCGLPPPVTGIASDYLSFFNSFFNSGL
jgi:hypothetical protein